VEQNKRNIERDPATYKKRQAIIEHTYGTIKRQWCFSYICTKRGLKRASADVGLMFAALNLRRLLNSIEKKVLKQYFSELVSLSFANIAPLKPFSALWLMPTITCIVFFPLKRAAA
jgi:hypothetical protein